MTEEREVMELNAVFVGAGPANLCAAYRLMKNIESHNAEAAARGVETIEEPMVLVIDKGAAAGNHNLSGAVVDPRAFQELFPDVAREEWPFLSPVTKDQIYFLTKNGQIPVPGPLLPKEMHNQDGQVASLAELTRWLSEKCEEAGVEVYTEFAATELLKDGSTVQGVRIGDKGLDSEGNPTDGFAPGMDLMAPVTVLGEGTRGFLSRQLIDDFKLDATANSQSWGLGMKEIIEIPEGRVKKGQVIHTFGYPLDWSTYGGSFLYAIDSNKVALGLVFGLDYPDPMLNSHQLFLKLKKHPLVAKIIEGGKVLEYGAKTLPEGGWWSLPKLSVDGAVLVGDSAGMLNPMRLKGIHLAMHSGMLAGDRLYEAMVKEDYSAGVLDYRQAFNASWAGEELHKARNFRQAYHHGLIPGMMMTGMHMFTGGALPPGRLTLPPDSESLKKAPGQPQAAEKVETDEELYLDILTDVYKSGAIHNEHQAAHCQILDPEKCKLCRDEYQMPCTRFCPAQVYEEKVSEAGAFEGIQVNFSNCVHCKTCEIKDPYGNVKWVPPEGGDGPKYQNM